MNQEEIIAQVKQKRIQQLGYEDIEDVVIQFCNEMEQKYKKEKQECQKNYL